MNTELTTVCCNPQNIVATLYDSTQTTIKSTTTQAVDVLKHDTMWSLNPITSSVIAGSGITFSGTLLDKDIYEASPSHSGAEISDRAITIQGTGAANLRTNLRTESLSFLSPSPANANLTVSSGKLNLPVGGIIQLPSESKTVILTLPTSTAVRVKVTERVICSECSGPTYTADSNPNSDTFPLTSTSDLGIQEIQILTVGGSSAPSGFVALSKVETVNNAGDPQNQHTVNFANVAAHAYPSPLEFDKGSFFSSGPSPSTVSSGWHVQAVFTPDIEEEYTGSVSEQLSYDTECDGCGTFSAALLAPLIAMIIEEPCILR